jgi:Transglutaminase-like superfamily
MRFILTKLPFTLIKFSLYCFVFCTPVLGVWLASSLVAYTNGPTWLAVFSGILLFPLIPVLWDLQGRKKRKMPGVFTWGDRLTLRTLILNLLFVFCLLALRPQISFLALSTRGDWMLDGRQGQTIEVARQSLFQLANGLEWLYLAVHQNPYRQYTDTNLIQPTPQPSGDSQPSPKPTANAQAAVSWPWEGVGLHPAIATMPASVETSIESVAKYIAEQEKDPFLRIKALHDYTADRIAYDAPAYFAGQYPDQDAQTVFVRRTAVCAGYAKLLEALGKAIGEEIIYVVGDSRSQTSDLSGQGHAWNAAKILGNWYLIDATWDSGSVDRSGFTKQYKTDYLFPPPAAMAVSHFPEQAEWQLLPNPLSRGEFLRQPMMRPRFFAEGLQLISPTRSQTDVQGDVTIQLENPKQRWLVASYGIKGSEQTQHCTEQATQGKQLACTLPGSGAYEVKLFSGNAQYGQYAYLGQVEFNKQ